MNYLYIFGNGFDMALGLRTSYPDFYKFYLEKPSENESVAKLKESIGKQKNETWADLEIGLGLFSSECPSVEAFLLCLDDIKDNLAKYLTEQEAKMVPHSGLGSFLYNPGSCLETLDSMMLEGFCDSCRARHPRAEDSYNIVTLNYTKTIETILSDIAGLPIKDPFHIHGNISNMVLGVNDESQIANIGFAKDLEFREEFAKPEYNAACRNARNETFSEMIRDADIIVIYGASMGLSDQKWWDAIGKRLMLGSVSLLYFPYNEKIDFVRHENHRERWTKYYVSELVKKLKIKDEIIPSLEGRVFIGINKSFLKPAGVKISAKVSMTSSK